MTGLYENIIKKYSGQDSPRRMHFNLGVHYLDQQLADKAQREIASALALKPEESDPQNWELHYLSAQTHLYNENQSEATKQFVAAAREAEDSHKTELYQTALDHIDTEVAGSLSGWAKGLIIPDSGSDKGFLHLLVGKVFQLNREQNSESLNIARKHFQASSEMMPENAMVSQSLKAVNALEQVEQLAVQVQGQHFQQANNLLDNIGGELDEVASMRKNYLRISVDYYQGILKAPDQISEQVALLTEIAGSYRAHGNSSQELGVLQLIARLQIGMGDFQAALDTLGDATRINRSDVTTAFIKTQALFESGIDLGQSKSLLQFISQQLPDLLHSVEAELEKARADNTTLLAFKTFVTLQLENSRGSDFTDTTHLLEMYGEEMHAASASFIRAEIIELSGGSPEEIATALFEAGRSYNLDLKNQAALYCFSRVEEIISFNPDITGTAPDLLYLGFEFANAIYGQSTLKTFPYYKRSELLEALDYWKEAIGQEGLQFKADQYWYFEVGAFIIEGLTALREKGANYWSCLYLSARALLQQSGYHSQACLARFLRLTDLTRPATFFATCSLNDYPEYEFAQDELTLAALNAGDFEMAKKYLTQMREAINDENHLSHYDAFMNYHEGAYDAALKILKENFEKDPADIWSLFMIMVSYVRKEDLEQTQQAARSIIELQGSEKSGDEHFFLGWAYHYVGNTAEAKRRFDLDTESGIGLTYMTNHFFNQLMIGEIDTAQELLDELLEWNFSLHRSRELQQDLRALSDRLADPKWAELYALSKAQIDDCLESTGRNWLGKVIENEKYLLSLEQPEVAQLTTELKRTQPEQGSEKWLGLKLSLMQICAGTGNDLQAYQLSQELSAHSLPGMDAFVAETLANCVYSGHQPNELSGLENWLAQDENPARLGRLLSARIKDAADYWRLSDFIKSEATQLSSLELTREELTGYWTMYMEAGEAAHQMELAPIWVWISNEQIPEKDPTEWEVITDYFPGIRKRLQDNYGILLPSTLIKDAQSYPSGHFAISINEISRLYDQVPKEVIEQDDKDFNQSHKFMADRLELIMEQRLHQFFTMADARNHLESARTALGETHSSIESALLRTYHSLLKTILKDGISIIHKAKIYQAFMANYEATGDFCDLINAVRGTLIEDLPVNREQCNRIEVASAIEVQLEQHIVARNEKRFLEIPADQLNELSQAIRNDLPADWQEQARTCLVVSKPEVRYYLRQVMLVTNALVKVASKSELSTNSAAS